MLLSLPIFPNDIQAYGNNLIATAILALALAWYLRHPAVAASSSLEKMPPVPTLALKDIANG